MKKLTHFSLIVLMLVLQACNLPSGETPTPTAETTDVTSEPVGQTPENVEPTQESPEATEGPAATVEVPAENDPIIPDGWVAAPVESLGFTIYHPEGWEVTVIPDRSKIDIRESGSDGWVEFAVVTQETSTFWAVADLTADPLNMLQSILSAASQDGTYQEPQSLERGAFTARGRDNIYSELVLYGVARFGDSPILMIGHVTADIPEEEQPTTADEYFPLYQQMFLSISK